MAGIGFKLKRIISENKLSSFLEASLTGAFIVAGPWLISIVTLSIISVISFRSSSDVLNDFFPILIYIFAFSLITTGGSHYLFTRIFSDYIYKDKIRSSLYLIIVYMVTVSIVSLLGSFFITYLFISNDTVLSLNIGITAMLINALWVILIFVSFLKWYLKILYSYLIGTIITTCSLLLFQTNLNTTLISYNLGNFIILTLLIVLSVTRYYPKKVKNIPTIFMSNFRKFNFLFLTGFFYYISIWIDKIMFWFTKGASSGEIVKLKIFYEYDIAMYIANISLIPGLIFFIINTETEFYINIKKFLISLVTSQYSIIILKRNRLIRDTNILIRNQTLSQFLLILAISFLLWELITINTILLIALWSVFFQLLIYSYINLLFYLNKFKDSFFMVLLMTILNIITFFIFSYPGLSYLLSAIITVVVIRLRVNFHLERLDRYIYTGEY